MRRTPTFRRPATVAVLACLALVPLACSGSDDGDGVSSGETSTVATDGTNDASEAPAEAVALGADFLGPATVGQPDEEAVTALVDTLGEPQASSAWSQPSCEFAGPDSEGAYTVTWLGLTVSLRGASSDTATFEAYVYSGADDGPTAELATPEGITIGSTGAEVAEAFGDAAVFDDASVFGPLWTVDIDGGQYILEVDGGTPESAVTRISLNPIFCD